MGISELSYENLIELTTKYKNYHQIIKSLNLSGNGTGNYKTLKQQLTKYNIEFISNRSIAGRSNKDRMSDDSVFVKESTYPRHALKRRIIKDKLMIYKCMECDNEGQHNNKPLVLQLDHINGVSNDNRLDNLQFLCPNCHSQTETFASKNLKK